MIGTSNQSQQQQQHRQTLRDSSPHQHQHLVNHRITNIAYDDDDLDEHNEKHGMKVGSNHQADIPQFVAYAPAPEYYEDEKAIRVWSPYNNIPDHMLDEFITKAKEKYFYSTEQALGMLSWHRFDLNRAYADLPNFVPYPNEWSVEDKVLFEQAYQFHEKQFNKIKQMLPEKSMANLVNYYYSWKKTRTRASLMERQSRRLAARRTADSDNTSDEEEVDVENENEAANTSTETDTQEAKGNAKDGPGATEVEISDWEIHCGICGKQIRANGEPTGVIIDTPVENFCLSCFIDYQLGAKELKTEMELGDCYYHPTGLPKKILFSFFDVDVFVRGSPADSELMLKQLDVSIHDVKRRIQSQKQKLSQVNDKIRPISDQISGLNMDEFADILPPYKPNDVWSQEETQLAIQGFRRYGCDFSAISDVVRTKSPEAIRLFYDKQRHRLGLESLVDEFEKYKRSGSI